MTTFLITGSNRGIGLELCKQIIARGDEVIATCRKASSELKNLAVRIEEDVDISSEDSINNLRQKLLGVKLDCLIHNAGIYEFNSIDDLDQQSIIRQFVVNALSPLSMTKSLKSLLKRYSCKFSFLSEHIFSNEFSINWFKPLPSNPNDFVPDAYIITNKTLASFSVIQACDAINLYILSNGLLLSNILKL